MLMQRLVRQRTKCLKTGMAMNGGNLTSYPYLRNLKHEQIDSYIFYITVRLAYTPGLMQLGA